MNVFIIVLLLLLVTAIGYTIFLLQKKQNGGWSEKLIMLEREKNRLLESKIRLDTELERKSEELWELRWDIKKIAKERDELSGRYETLIGEKTELQSTCRYVEKDLREAREILSLHEAEAIRKEREFEVRIGKLASAEKALEDERQRIRRQDEQEQISLREEQARIWNDHEQMVLARLREACERSSLGFTLYENTNLPSIFTKLKPDAVVSFLGQYIIFDAKKSKSIRTYIAEQVKSTARKYKDIPEIYRTVFFIVPAEELNELRSLSYIEEGYTFYIISIESIEPILSSFKKISEYDTIADFDPQDREIIVNLIANYDRHISLQNAANIVFTKESIGLMSSKDWLHEEIQKEIANRKDAMRTKKLDEGEIKKIAQSMSEQEAQVRKLLRPEQAIKDDEWDKAAKILDA